MGEDQSRAVLVPELAVPFVSEGLRAIQVKNTSPPTTPAAISHRLPWKDCLWPRKRLSLAVAVVDPPSADVESFIPAPAIAVAGVDERPPAEFSSGEYSTPGPGDRPGNRPVGSSVGTTGRSTSRSIGASEAGQFDPKEFGSGGTVAARMGASFNLVGSGVERSTADEWLLSALSATRTLESGSTD